MQETLRGVPESIQHNYESFSNDYGKFYKHKIKMLDGTKCIVISKTETMDKFIQGQECEYHILEHLKDDIKKIKYGEPWTGGTKEAHEQAKEPTTGNRDELIVRQVCVKAAATLLNQSKDIYIWKATAEEMYRWIMKVPDSKLELNEPDFLDEKDDEDVPF